jgi:uncharacterized protein YlxW (UPF0749 family)
MEQSTVNEYIFGQQRSVLFQENYQRSQKEQKLYMAWQQAVSGWRNANSEIAQLKSVVTNLQKHVEELQAKTRSTDVAEPSGLATPISSNKESEYQTDEEELARLSGLG